MVQTPEVLSPVAAERYSLQGKTCKPISKYEYSIRILMILIAISSIVWSLSIYMMPIEFRNAFVGAKLSFHQRHFELMTSKERAIFNQDLQALIDRLYTEKFKMINDRNSSDVISEKRIMVPEEITGTTKKPKSRKISHVFQTIEDVRFAQDHPEVENTEEDENSTTLAQIKFNATEDRLFLSNNTFTVQSANWFFSSMMSLVEGIPFLSEIVSIVWTAMFLIFQSSIKKYSVVPKPWRIVLPSIVMFSIMTLICSSYSIVALRDIKIFCQQLRNNLTDPTIIKCGEALTVLRPVIIYQKIRPDLSLSLFRISLLVTLTLWILSLIIMLVRYFLAVDFQGMDVPDHFPDSQSVKKFNSSEYTEVPLEAPPPTVTNLQVNANRSLDDFESAKSHLSEVATPLL